MISIALDYRFALEDWEVDQGDTGSSGRKDGMAEVGAAGCKNPTAAAAAQVVDKQVVAVVGRRSVVEVNSIPVLWKSWEWRVKGEVEAGEQLRGPGRSACILVVVAPSYTVKAVAVVVVVEGVGNCCYLGIHFQAGWDYMS